MMIHRVDALHCRPVVSGFGGIVFYEGLAGCFGTLLQKPGA